MAKKEPNSTATLVDAYVADGKLALECRPVEAYKASDGSLYLTKEEAERRSWYIAAGNALELFVESEFTSTRYEIHQSLLKNAGVLAAILKDIANG